MSSIEGYYCKFESKQRDEKTSVNLDVNSRHIRYLPHKSKSVKTRFRSDFDRFRFKLRPPLYFHFWEDDTQMLFFPPVWFRIEEVVKLYSLFFFKIGISREIISSLKSSRHFPTPEIGKTSDDKIFGWRENLWPQMLMHRHRSMTDFGPIFVPKLWTRDLSQIGVT